MIEACHGLRFAAKTRQCFLRISVVRQNPFQRDDPPRMPLPGAINNPHPATPDLFENLIIAQSPIGIAHVDFSEHVLQRFSVVSVSAKTTVEQTTQTKTPRHARCRCTFWARDRSLTRPRRARIGGGAHG